MIKHDIHHLLTGYSASSILGESEISAWEIASGRKKYWAAFLIDIHRALPGLWINPYKVLVAYARGQRTKNRYHDLVSDQIALTTPVKELRTLVKPDQFQTTVKPTFSDFISFGLFLIPSVIYALLSTVLLPFIILYTVYVAIFTTKTT